MFSKNNKKMIAERSAERTLKYGLVKLNVGLASVLLATGLTFAGGQAASADTVTTNTEAQTTEVAPGQNDATTEATETTNKADAKAATLPQMGEKDNNEAAVVGLGLAGVAGALGLGVLNKKRS